MNIFSIASLIYPIIKIVEVLDKTLDTALMKLGCFGRIIKIYPIDVNGENIFHRFDSNTNDLTTLDRFFVKIHFKLWTKYQLTIVNFNLVPRVKSELSTTYRNHKS
jgi:hypothetical protein